METKVTRVASVTGQTLPPTLAATCTHAGVVTGMGGEGMKRQATGEFSGSEQTDHVRLESLRMITGT